MSAPSWLPPLIEYAAFSGDYGQFLDAVYARFCDDFVKTKPAFPKRRFALKRHPLTLGKEATFWHLVSSGPVEDERLPDLRRMECVPWVRPIIERVGTDEVRTWMSSRGTEPRISVALPDFSYLVVLADRGDDQSGRYVLLWTAFLIEHGNQRRRREKEYTEWIQSQKS